MASAPDGSASYRAMRDCLDRIEDTVPGKLEITKEGIVYDTGPGAPS